MNFYVAVYYAQCQTTIDAMTVRPSLAVERRYVNKTQNYCEAIRKSPLLARLPSLYTMLWTAEIAVTWGRSERFRIIWTWNPVRFSTRRPGGTQRLRHRCYLLCCCKPPLSTSRCVFRWWNDRTFIDMAELVLRKVCRNRRVLFEALCKAEELSGTDHFIARTCFVGQLV